VKIVVTTGGTLGDIVPFCAIAKVLAGRGHEVVVATSPDYQVLVESLGLQFAKVGGSFRALIETPLGRAWNSTESSRVYMKLTRELLVPLMAQTTADMRGAARKSKGDKRKSNVTKGRVRGRSSFFRVRVACGDRV
jgi:sterol 3beta-glucosyltransferase